MSLEHTIIRGGTILDPAWERAEQADILLANGRIVALGPPGMEAPTDATVVPGDDRLLMPGLVNAHTHSHGGLGRGAVDDRVPLELFLNASGAINGSRTVEDKYLSAALSAAEMIRKGCTACYDLFVEFPAPSTEGLGAVCQAYQDLGMRAVVAPMMADRTLYQALPGLLDAMPARLRARYEALATAPFHVSIDVCRRAFHQWAFDRTRIRPAVAPTIPLHCSDDFLAACGALAHDFDIPLQTHLAETKTQAMLAYRKYGKSLTAHLDDLGLLTGRFGAAHAIWIDDDDVMRLADKGARVAHNPLSNLRLGSGVAPVRRMLDHRLPVGIGTDGSNTSDGQNMFEALRLAAYLSRLQGAEHETWLSAGDALRLATLGSAELLGFDRIGRIAPGYEADLVFLRLDSPHFVPLRSPLLQTVFAETGASVQTVIIGGYTVFDNGHLLTIDEAKLRRQAEDAAARLDTANASTAHSAADIADVVGAFCVAHGRARHHVHRRLQDNLTS